MQKLRGEYPDDWNIINLEDLCLKIMKGIFDLNPVNYVNKGIPFLRISDIKDNIVTIVTTKFISEGLNKKFPSSELHPGDIVISKVGSVGLSDKIAKIPISISCCNISQNIIGIKVNSKKLDSDYLLYLLQLPSYMSKISSGSNATTLKSIQLEVLRKLPVPALQLKEQQMIVSILLRIDELMQKADQIIEQIQRLKKSVMERLLTKGIGHVKFKESKMGKIPQDWNVTKIKDITSEHKQGYYTNEDYVNDGIKLVRISDLFNPRLAYETMPSLIVDEKTYKQYKVDVGDFLIARSGATIGRYGIATKNIPCIFASYLIRFRFDSNKLNNFFFGILFESKYILGQLTRIKQSTSNININAENIKSLEIALPTLQEQFHIVTVLSSLNRVLESEQNKRQSILKIKKGLMTQLLTGKIRVKI